MSTWTLDERTAYEGQVTDWSPLPRFTREVANHILGDLEEGGDIFDVTWIGDVAHWSDYVDEPDSSEPHEGLYSLGEWMWTEVERPRYVGAIAVPGASPASYEDHGLSFDTLEQARRTMTAALAGREPYVRSARWSATQDDRQPFTPPLVWRLPSLDSDSELHLIRVTPGLTLDDVHHGDAGTTHILSVGKRGGITVTTI